MLEIAEFAIGAGVIAQRGAARLHRLQQDGPDGFGQRSRPGRRHGFRRAARRQARAVQRLADIDIAEAGDDLLVQEGRLQRGRPFFQRFQEERGAELVAERLYPERAYQGMGAKLAAVAQQHEAEATRVIIDDTHAAVGGEDDMVVRGKARAFVMEAARHIALDPERA